MPIQIDQTPSKTIEINNDAFSEWRRNNNIKLKADTTLSGNGFVSILALKLPRELYQVEFAAIIEALAALEQNGTLPEGDYSVSTVAGFPIVADNAPNTLPNKFEVKGMLKVDLALYYQNTEKEQAQE